MGSKKIDRTETKKEERKGIDQRWHVRDDNEGVVSSS